MAIDIIPLGTASALPTRHRHLSALVLRHRGTTVLFDCGEGTQFQLLHAGVKHSGVVAVCLTHFHGDHVFGLPGLLATMALLGREAPLTLIGPVGLRAFAEVFPERTHTALPFPVRFVELAEDVVSAVVLEADAFTVTAQALDHRIRAVGYRFEEKPRPGHLDVAAAQALGVTDYRDYRALKAGEAVRLADESVVRPEQVVGPSQPGRVFAYVTDTRPCPGGIALARGADLVYHDATFGDDLAEWADKTGHSTARQAAEVTRAADARRLLLGHFSARYKDVAPLVAQARAVFQNTEAAEELKRYDLAGPSGRNDGA